MRIAELGRLGPADVLVVREAADPQPHPASCWCVAHRHVETKHARGKVVGRVPGGQLPAR